MPPTTKMTSDQFAQSIKDKYPAYANIDNATLTQKMLAKYPVYSDKVDLTPPKTDAPPAPENLGVKTAKQVVAGGEKIVGSIKQGADKFAAVPDIKRGTSVKDAVGIEAKKTGALLETGLGAASGAATAVMAPFTATFQKILEKSGLDLTPKPGMGKDLLDKLNGWAKQHPEAATNLSDIVNVVGTALADVGGAKNPLNAGAVPKSGSLSMADLINPDGKSISELSEDIPTGEKSFTKGPIDVAKTDKGYIILDGQHRAAEALASGESNINANILSKEDAIAKYGDRWPHIEDSLSDSGIKGQLKTIKSNVTDAAKGMTEDVKNVRGAVKGFNAVADDATKVSDLSKMISPKPTAKEVKLALDEERIVSGQDPGLLRGGTPDEIMPSAETQRAAATIADKIPGAENMKAPELYKATGAQVKEMSEAIKPVMQTTPVSEETVTKMTSSWESIKAKQMADAWIPDGVNVERLQADFEARINSAGLDNMDDLWDARKAYDASIPQSVKDANSLSSEALQAKKVIWLQNRSVFNDAIKDVSSGLGEVAQKTFSEMSDMYTAQQGMRSSYKLVKEGAASLAGKLHATIREHPLVTGAAAIEAGRKAITGKF